MKVLSVKDPAFKEYGRVLEGYDVQPLLEAMKKIELPAEGTSYVPSEASLEKTAVYEELQDRAFGGMPVQLGMCWGRNRKLNCLEYHRDSEVNVGTGAFILLLAKRSQIEERDGKAILDTSLVKAFLVPAGTVVEVFATTLHYAPCAKDSFRVAVVLPKGTNTEKKEIAEKDPEDEWLFARNKWLLAHKDAPEAASGAYIALAGENIELKEEDFQ